MLNLIQMMSMRVEPPKPGTGRVHILSDRAPTKAETPEKNAALMLTNERKKEQAERLRAVSRREILQAIADGSSTRAEMADQCLVSMTTVDNRCRELLAKKLIRVSQKDGKNRYRVTGDGLLELATNLPTKNTRAENVQDT